MNKVTFFKTASLFFFLLTAQFSYGQQCSDYPDYSPSASYTAGDQVHYLGEIWQSRYGNNVVPSGSNVDYVDCTLGGANWCFVFSCNTDPCQISTLLTNDDFESSYGNWNDGGSDSSRETDFACDGSYKVRLRDDSSSSNITSDTYNLTSYDKITIAFQYYVKSFENNEDWFLEFSSDNGSNWTTIEQYVVDDDFTEWTCYDETITILASNQTFNSQNKLRFRCDASKDDDQLYIDNITVSGIDSLNPAASFTSSAFSVYPNQEINFTNNTSGNGNSYSWDFGDGSSTSTLTSPSHQYTTTGTYTVTLTATNSCGSSTATTTIEVTNGPITLFFEDFEDEADGATTGTAQGAVNWSSSVSDSEEVGYIGVYTYQGDKEFYIEMEEDDEYAYWTTDAIDISNYEDVNFSLDVGEYGGIDSDHYIKTEYSTNNGASWNTATVNGYLNDDLGDGVDNQVSQDGINANSLIIRIKVVNKDDEHFFDDILVQGQLKLPGCATNLSPANADTNVSLTPQLSWNAPASGGPVEIYKIYYGTDSSTSTYFGETANTSVTLPQLENNTQYFWKVVPTNVRGGASGCSAISFTTVPLAPGCASYTSPTDGAVDVSVTPQLSWSTATGATGYKVYYGTDGGDLGTPITLGEVTSYQLPQLGYETQYFWKVVPFNSGGEASGCSVISFTTQKNPAGSLFITGSSITVSKNAYLYLEKDFTNTGGSVTLNSDSNEFASIVVEGSASGDITYNKYVNYVGSDEWDLVGSPVTTQSVSDFVTANDDPLAIDPTGPTYYAIGTHDAATNNFTNYTGATVGDAGNFTPAKGYQMATDYGATMAFTGEVATTTQTVNIQNQNGANGGVGVRWNLVANPFPSYIKGNIAADATHNFLKVNDNIIDSSFLAAYGWKADGTGYEIYNYATGSTGLGSPLLIAPGQGFFVAAASSDVAQVQFTPEMRTVAGGDDFINGAPILLNYNFDLKLFHGNSEKAETSYFFQEGLTLGLDPGYDAGALDQLTPLSSRLPEADTGVNLQINAMSLESAYNQTIPLVINQQEGQTFRISISNNTLPEDINVYLEDVLNGTLTPLNEQDFELSAQEDLSDDGRFYLHFTTQSLAIDDVLNPNNINLYKLNTDTFITIKGLTPDMGKTSAALYNILGMKVRQKALNTSQDTHYISTRGLASGVYIIKLNAGDVSFSKKVIIQ